VKNFRQLVGKKIRSRRIEMGFPNQDALARALDITQSQVNKWETGKHLPEKSWKESLMKVLNTDESLFDIGESVPRYDFSVAADFLSKFANLPPAVQKFVLGFVYEDKTFWDELPVDVLRPLLKRLKSLEESS
jgi:transcriptional regulator with XRE-family HTH domain